MLVKLTTYLIGMAIYIYIIEMIKNNSDWV